VAMPATGTLYEGTSTGTVTVAAFNDLGNPTTVAESDYSATIKWGDGATSSVSSSGIVWNASTTQWDVQGSHTYAETGNYTISVTIYDGLKNSATVTTLATVADAALAVTAGPVTGTEGTSTGTITAGYFTDPGNPLNVPQSDYSDTINWGSGEGTSVGKIVWDNVNNRWDVTGSHTYASDSAATAITLTVTDGAQVVTQSGTLNLIDPALANATGVGLKSTENVSTGTVTVATFTDPSNPGNVLLAGYNATIAWGDTQTSAGTIVYDANHHVWDVKGSHTYADEGTYTVQVTINDSTSNRTVLATPSAAIVADAAITASQAPVAYSMTEGNLYGPVVVATFTDADTAATAADFSGTITWGDGSSETFNSTTSTNNPSKPSQVEVILVSISPAGAVFQVMDSGTHVYAEEGTYHVKVVINDVGGSTATANGTTVTVADASLTTNALLSPTALAAPSSPEYIGVSTGSVEVATFTDNNLLENQGTFGASNSAALLGDFSGTINWGDGTTSSFTSANVSVDTANPGLIGDVSLFDVYSSHTYATAGNYNVTAVVKDKGGSSVAVAGPTVTVTNAFSSPGSGATASAPATMNAVEGNSTGTQVWATFTDDAAAVAGDFSGTIVWGDGTTSNFTSSSIGTITPSAPGVTTFAVKAAHTYAEEGHDTVQVTINDKRGGSPAVPNSTAVTVADAPLTPSKSAVGYIATEGITTGNIVVGTWYDGNPTAPVSDFSPTLSTINWGDGTTQTFAAAIAVVTKPSGGYFTVAGNHVYATPGSYKITVSVNDVGGSTTTVTNTTVTVKDAAKAVVQTQQATAGHSFTTGSGSWPANLVTFTDADPSAPLADFSATINWGDGITSVATITQPGGLGTVFDVNGTHTFNPMVRQTYYQTITIKDMYGNSAAAYTSIVDPPVASGSASINDAALLSFLSGSTGPSDGPAINKALTPAAVSRLFGQS